MDGFYIILRQHLLANRLYILQKHRKLRLASVYILSELILMLSRFRSLRIRLYFICSENKFNNDGYFLHNICHGRKLFCKKSRQSSWELTIDQEVYSCIHITNVLYHCCTSNLVIFEGRK